MNTCPKCQAPLEQNQNFCVHCGYSAEYQPPANIVADGVPFDSNRTGTGGMTPNAELMARARASLRGRWGVAVGTFVLFGFLTIVVSLIPYLGSLAMLLCAGPMTLGIVIFVLTLSREEEEPRTAQIFDGFQQFGTALGAYWLMFLFVFLWSLLLYIPGIIAGFRYSMTYYIIADNPEIGPLEAINRSKELMMGNKWKLFCLGFRFIGWILLGYITLGIGFLWIGPYIATSFAKFYEDVLPVDATAPESV